jgi:hypothetical protein
MFWRNTLCTYRWLWHYVPVDDGWEEVLGRNVYITSQYFSPNAKYWTASWNPYIILVCLRPNAKYWTASSGNRTRVPPDWMWTLYHWAMESVHNMGVLVSWPPGRGQILCNYSTPPPTSKHPCINYRGGGGALPASPLPLNTCSHNTATRRPLHPSNTQQHTRTPNNRQQHTTTVLNSTRVHKITNVPLFKKLWDFFDP